jgi:hypothetical protein
MDPRRSEMPIQALERAEGTIRVVVAERLVPGDVRSIGHELSTSPPGARLEVDLREARTCEAQALLMLARRVEETGTRAAFVGLTESERRLLHYLGYEPGRTRR